MTVYVASPGVMSRGLEDEIVVLDTVSGAYYRLNETGSLIWTRLLSTASVDDLADHLSEVCEIDRDLALRDVVELLDALCSRGLVAASG